MLETFFWLAFALSALLAAYGVIRWSQTFPDEEPQIIVTAPELQPEQDAA